MHILRSISAARCRGAAAQPGRPPNPAGRVAKACSRRFLSPRKSECALGGARQRAEGTQNALFEDDSAAVGLWRSPKTQTVHGSA